MLRSFAHLRGSAIQASDGEIGSLRDVYFDDQSTLIRYFVVDTGTWLPGRRVLLAPAAVGGVDAERGGIVTGLTRQQVEDSPSSDLDQPVSRQQETTLHAYYGWEPYWAAPPLAGSLAPYWGIAVPEAAHAPADEDPVARKSRRASARSATRICAARARWRATASRRPTGRSVASTTSSSTIGTGRSSCSASIPATGCPAARSWSRPAGCAASTGPGTGSRST